MDTAPTSWNYPHVIEILQGIELSKLQSDWYDMTEVILSSPLLYLSCFSWNCLCHFWPL